MNSLNRRSLIQILLGTALASDSFAQESVVSTPLGRLEGIQKGTVKIFLGIPFAEPPVAKLRFQAPLPAKPWTGIRQAISPSAAPTQAGKSTMSEDCLYLNVFTPAGPGPHPVFVWIYGGGNIAGSANNPNFEGSTFARDGVVCVVINYRVGALGFLELGNGSGNNAIKDQVLALRWVQQNIAAFGGDPHNVTVGGQSAGAKNVAALMAVPDAKGLFHRAIIESGSAQTVFTLPEAQAVTSLLLSSAQVNVSQLLSMPATDLLQAQSKLLATYPANYPFRPVVDGKFLPHVPLIELSQPTNVDLLIGTNRDEMVAFVDPRHAALALNQKEIGNAKIDALQPVEAAYQSAFPTLSTADRHIRILTAEEYWIPSVRIAEARNALPAKTYMYRFDYASSSGPFANRSAHGSESHFVWDHAAPETRTLASEIHSAWVSFIRNGHPVATGLPAWPSYRLEKRETMILNEQCRVESDPNGVERQIWSHRL